MKLTLSKSGLLLPERKIERAPASDVWRQGPNPRWDEKRVRDYCERQRHEKRWKPKLAFAYVGSTSANSTGASASNSGVDTSTADFLAVVASDYPFTGTLPTISDNKSNANWVRLTSQGTNFTRTVMFYCWNPTVGSNHICTVVTVSGLVSFCFAWYSGSQISSDPFDAENGNYSN